MGAVFFQMGWRTASSCTAIGFWSDVLKEPILGPSRYIFPLGMSLQVLLLATKGAVPIWQSAVPIQASRHSVGFLGAIFSCDVQGQLSPIITGRW